MSTENHWDPKDEAVSVSSETLSRIEIPDLEPAEYGYDLDGNIGDYQDLMDIESAQRNARITLFQVTDKINECDRKATETKLRYDRTYKRYYLAGYTIKPEAARRMNAELKCESIEDELIQYETLKREYERIAYTLRDELRALASSGNNLRQQLRTS